MAQLSISGSSLLSNDGVLSSDLDRRRTPRRLARLRALTFVSAILCSAEYNDVEDTPVCELLFQHRTGQFWHIRTMTAFISYMQIVLVSLSDLWLRDCCSHPKMCGQQKKHNEEVRKLTTFPFLASLLYAYLSYLGSRRYLLHHIHVDWSVELVFNISKTLYFGINSFTFTKSIDIVPWQGTCITPGMFHNGDHELCTSLSPIFLGRIICFSITDWWDTGCNRPTCFLPGVHSIMGFYVIH